MHNNYPLLSMFIFDNILFATFIPQILMFLGFISCFTAQLLSSTHQEKQEFSQEVQSIAYVEESKQIHPIAYFYEYGISQNNSMLTNISDKLFLKESPRFDYPKFTFLFQNINISFSLFSRPPPFFFL